MKLCAVQWASQKGDLAANLSRHLRCIEQAATLGADVVVFPELSLTGYEPALARTLALPASTDLLTPLQALCDRLGITAAVGLPLSTAEGIRIGMPILRPGLPRLTYAKQRLHADELPFFTAGDQPMVFAVGQRQLAPAICYESMFMTHAEAAQALGAELYLVSVAKTAKGIREGHEHYRQVACSLGIPVLMANCVGPTDNFTGAGGSAAWDNHGNLLAVLDDRQEGLVLLDIANNSALGVPLDASIV
ncbi:carbon-nitrogen hydrolase family protein [Pseudomonas putida]|uniref:Carbon-nitrogen hydrolase family protein n=1 Tax=Pseudomonas putida TaxID=303 RepID=A0A7W2QLN6_PSEPU|nr:MULTISPECIES: carbon-nitrogen hydrolase family protein [Pseudomonas]MBA6119230.1 carbon-nitrogen hydrolase family protein [Pseudomonas putida]MBI6944596.1 carbon-nitrogen hydrolase family protein [Pseudomonas putida]MBI6960901.1 carbon-nitrogen hydrolase family protein [Pseudomonas putida]MCZ9639685.1 carbon-nitrogen hydrolase family protein [Pseudomonas putida]MEC4878509.1 carbon-nitrogen hydrolase family protein [Pseudomonas sp. NC26]